jgi:hypothetical protein
LFAKSKRASEQASERARKQGRKQGSQEGRKQGSKEGRKQGRKEAACYPVHLKDILAEMMFLIHQIAQQAFLKNGQLHIDIFIDWKSCSIQFVKYFLKNIYISEERPRTC